MVIPLFLGVLMPARGNRGGGKGGEAASGTEAGVGGSAEEEGSVSGSKTEITATGRVSASEGDAVRLLAFAGAGGGAGEGARLSLIHI